MRGTLVLLVLVWPSVLIGSDFEVPNQFLRDGAIGYGNVLTTLGGGGTCR